MQLGTKAAQRHSMYREYQYIAQGGIILSAINNEIHEHSVEAAHQCRCHERMELARAYVPMQGFGKISRPEIGLRHGTIFPELLRPYHAKQAR